MKRANPPASAPRKHTSQPSGKRTKSGQACASCRKHKTRCEILDDGITYGIVKCHRCKVLNIECSFESSDVIRVLPQTPQALTFVDQYTATSQTDQKFFASSSTGTASSTTTQNSSSTGATSPSNTAVSGQPPDPEPYDRSISNVALLDWTATPMLSIYDMSLGRPRHLSDPPIRDQAQISPSERLLDILSPEQIYTLLYIFDEHYTPWLAFQLITDGNPTPFLDLVRCTVASRHLDYATRAVVAPRLQRLTEGISLQQTFAPSAPLECIQSCLILSLWSPTTGYHVPEQKDARLLVASAISMAMNINLAQTSMKANRLRHAKWQNPETWTSEMEKELTDLSRKAQLWIGLVTTECMLCLGTGRTPLSMFSEADQEFMNTTSYLTLSQSRETRLGLTAKLYMLSENANRIRLIGDEGLRPFYTEAIQLLMKLDFIERLIAPLPVVSPYDTSYYRALQLQYHTCRLLVLHHFLQELRTAFGRNHPIPWFKASCQGTFVVTAWGRDALATAEASLANYLTTAPDVPALPSSIPTPDASGSYACSSPSGLPAKFLSTYPDHLSLLVTFSCAWLVVPNFSIRHMQNSQLGDVSKDMVRLTRQRMEKIAACEDHVPNACARLIGALVSTWEKEKRAEMIRRRQALQGVANGAQKTVESGRVDRIEVKAESHELDLSALREHVPGVLPPPQGEVIIGFTESSFAEAPASVQQPQQQRQQPQQQQQQQQVYGTPAPVAETHVPTTTTTVTTTTTTTHHSVTPVQHQTQTVQQQPPVQFQPQPQHPYQAQAHQPQQQQRQQQMYTQPQGPMDMHNDYAQDAYAHQGPASDAYPAYPPYASAYPPYTSMGMSPANPGGGYYPLYNEIVSPPLGAEMWTSVPLVSPPGETEFWNEFLRELMVGASGGGGEQGGQ